MLLESCAIDLKCDTLIVDKRKTQYFGTTVWLKFYNPITFQRKNMPGQWDLVWHKDAIAFYVFRIYFGFGFMGTKSLLHIS